jgi:hypothetical protein
MRSILLLAAACTQAPPQLPRDDAEVQVIASGGPSVLAQACLDAGLLSCGDSTASVALIHGGVTTPMRYGGLWIPEFQTDAPLGDVATPFEVQVAGASATMTLPSAFDVAGGPSATIAMHDVLHLTWTASPAPMQWDQEWKCVNTSGAGGFGGPFEDRGTLDVSVADLAAAIADAAGVDEIVAPCVFTLKIDRFELGSVGPGFPATVAAGIQRRKVLVTVDRE